VVFCFKRGGGEKEGGFDPAVPPADRARNFSLFTASDAIGFSYGVSWNMVRRNIFNWEDEDVGKVKAKVKSFCAIPQALAFLKEYIVFAEKDEELNK
jgi:hypothetical protein